MLFEKEEANKLIKEILSYSKAESAVVYFKGSNSQNLRFALNTVSTCGAINSVSADIVSNFGKRSGTVTITSIEDEMIKRGVRQSEEIAKLSPESKEFMPPLDKQSGYLEVKEFFEDTDKLVPQNISDKVSHTLKKAVGKDLQAAGFFENKSSFNSIGNTNDLFAYHKKTNAGFSATIRTSDGKDSSKINRMYADINLLDVNKLSDYVIDKALLSKDPMRHEPGKYVTILDNAAVSDMIDYLMGYITREVQMREEVFSLKRIIRIK